MSNRQLQHYALVLVLSSTLTASHRFQAQDGDIVNIDVTVFLDGHHGDTSRMYYVGNVTPEAKKLCEVRLACRRHMTMLALSYQSVRKTNLHTVMVIILRWFLTSGAFNARPGLKAPWAQIQFVFITDLHHCSLYFAGHQDGAGRSHQDLQTRRAVQRHR